MGSVRTLATGSLLVAGPLLAACDIFTALGGGETLRCTRDDSCPAAMTCLAGRCLNSDASDRGHDGGGVDIRSDLGWTDHPASELPVGIDAGHVDAAPSDVEATPDVEAVADVAVVDVRPPDAGWCQPNCIGQIVAGGTCPTDGGCSCHTCTLFRDGTVKCWGRNNYGQLGLGDAIDRGDGQGEMGENLPVVDLGIGQRAILIAARTTHTCAVLAGGAVKCWGNNTSGALGLGDTAHRGNAPGEMGDNLPAVSLGTGRIAIEVALGTAFACARFDDGAVKCWGDNAAGQLGLGDTRDRGDGPGEMGDALPAVQLGASHSTSHIYARAQQACAILDDGALKCWGDNRYGQLGLGDTFDRGDQLGDMGDNLPPVSLGVGRSAVDVTIGSNFVCALLDNATVKCWGVSGNGNLGLGDNVFRGDNSGEMGDALPAVDVGTGRTVNTVAAGGLHVCALLDDNTVKCWGDNDDGQLGLGDVAQRGDAAIEMGDQLPAVDLGSGLAAPRGIAASATHNCVLLEPDGVKCWGNNKYGHLGLGDTEDRGDAPGEMGSALPAVDLGL